jgi:hypothetical protein
MALTAIAAKNAQATDRDYKLFDSQGLFLLVTRAGTRSWRYKYRYGGKEKLLTFGQYPEITLAGAREQRDKARGVLREGKDQLIEDPDARPRLSPNVRDDTPRRRRNWDGVMIG